MKIASFNVNSLRMRLDKVLFYLEQEKPDILALQEIKMTNEIFPTEAFSELGYYSYPNGQKQYHGVALLSKQKAERFSCDFPVENSLQEKRIQFVDYQTADNKILTVINGYFPQGESRKHETKFPIKREFYTSLLQSLQLHYNQTDYLVILGDFNIAPTDLDIGIGESNAKRWLAGGKCSFLPEEREWIQALFDWGLVDSFRLLHPNENDQFSWFDYRSRGFEDSPKRGLRIDHILLNQPLQAKLTSSEIDYTLRSQEKPSDHCLVFCELSHI